MRANQKIKTSIFSQYQNNQNDSLSSRQLEYWLKHTAPTVQPKFAGIEWTLMSTNSIFEQEEHTLQRNETYQSLNKQNDQLAYNSARPTICNNSGITKSKSYVNAMVDLQNRVKQVEQQNKTLTVTVNALKEQRNRSMSESTHVAQELRQRLQKLEPKTKKIQELVKDNKILRDMKEENARKSRILEKVNKENQIKLIEYEKNLQKQESQLKAKENKMEQIRRQLEQQTKDNAKLKQAFQKLQEKNRMLEDMKEKSTSSIIEKYNKSVDMVETLTNQNMQLKKDLMKHKQIGQEALHQLQQNHHHDKQQLICQVQRLRQELKEKKEKCTLLAKDADSFKGKYDKVNEDLIATLRKHSLEIAQLKLIHEKQLTKQKENKQKQIVYVEKKVKENKEQQLDIIKESRIENKEHPKIQIQSHLEFDDIHETQEDQQEEVMLHETRSLEKEQHSHFTARQQKPSDALSQEYSRKPQFINPKTSSIKRKPIISAQKSRRHSHQKQLSQLSKMKSRSKSRQIEKPSYPENDHSFILKSCEPATHYDHGEQLIYSREPQYYHSATHNPKAQYPYEMNEVAQFATSQRGNASSTQAFSLEKALLNQANKQAVRLVEEQEKCFSLLNQNLGQQQRAENLGMLRQINTQIKANTEKILELKSRIH